jgi:ABC-2 type transporter
MYALHAIPCLPQAAALAPYLCCKHHQLIAVLFCLSYAIAVHQVLLLQKGRTAYYGPQRELVNYFTGLGLELPQFTNPAGKPNYRFCY